MQPMGNGCLVGFLTASLQAVGTPWGLGLWDLGLWFRIWGLASRDGGLGLLRGFLKIS